jgi:hypothetical protein
LPARLYSRVTAAAVELLLFTGCRLGQSPQMALAHFKHIADATDLPLKHPRGHALARHSR